MTEKVKILFVDDEADVLIGLKRMLHSQRKEWEMYFVESGTEALEMLARSKVDAIVADMRMPGMDGGTLLEIVSQKYPEIIRIILSGHADEEMVLRTIKPSHQYLAKPCNPEALKKILNRALSLRDLLSEGPLKELISRIKSLPSLPKVYLELMETLRSPDVPLRKIGDIISRDMGMTARILQLVNSAYFGIPRRISRATEAVNFLGINIIKAVVLSLRLFSQFDQQKMKALSVDKLFRHALETAVFARKITELETRNNTLADESFMAGMLHDVGKLVLADNLPEAYGQALQKQSAENLPDWQAERETIGATHSEVGAYLIGLWGIPESIVEALAFHHHPQKSSDPHFGPVTAIHVANALAHQSIDSLDDQTALALLDHKYLEEIGCTDRLSAWREVCRSLSEVE